MCADGSSTEVPLPQVEPASSRQYRPSLTRVNDARCAGTVVSCPRDSRRGGDRAGRCAAAAAAHREPLRPVRPRARRLAVGRRRSSGCMAALGRRGAGGPVVDLPAQAPRTARRPAGRRRRRLRAHRGGAGDPGDGDARIFGRRRAEESDGWLLVVFSVPESERDKRHQLRSQLTRLGFGTVAPGVWVAPGHLADEAAEVLARRGLAGYVDLFRGASTSAPSASRWPAGGTSTSCTPGTRSSSTARSRCAARVATPPTPVRPSPTTSACSPTGGGCPTLDPGSAADAAARGLERGAARRTCSAS